MEETKQTWSMRRICKDRERDEGLRGQRWKWRDRQEKEMNPDNMGDRCFLPVSVSTLASFNHGNNHLPI